MPPCTARNHFVLFHSIPLRCAFFPSPAFTKAWKSGVELLDLQPSTALVPPPPDLLEQGPTLLPSTRGAPYRAAFRPVSSPSNGVVEIRAADPGSGVVGVSLGLASRHCSGCRAVVVMWVLGGGVVGVRLGKVGTVPPLEPVRVLLPPAYCRCQEHSMHRRSMTRTLAGYLRLKEHTFLTARATQGYKAATHRGGTISSPHLLPPTPITIAAPPISILASTHLPARCMNSVL